MMAGIIMGAGEGERLHAARRRRFWLILGGLALIGAIGGFVGGFVTGFSDAGGPANSPEFAYLGAAGVALTAVLMIYGSWKFFVGVDEVELADNLWGSLIGFYAYAILLPAWWALAKLNLVREPNHWVIYGASLGIARAAYLYRTWRYN